MMTSDWEYSDLQCPACGRNMREASCWLCLGAGEFNLYEEDPINHSPGECEDCSECNGEGSVTWCTCGYVENNADD